MRAVRRAGGVAVDMADFGARDQRSPEVCRAEVAGCVYMGVVGFGSLVPGRDGGLSFTEFEFDVAGEAGLPRQVFLLDEAVAAVPVALVDVDRHRVARFRRRLQVERITVVVANPDDLAARVGEGWPSSSVPATCRSRSGRAPPDSRDFSGAAARWRGGRDSKSGAEIW